MFKLPQKIVSHLNWQTTRLRAFKNNILPLTFLITIFMVTAEITQLFALFLPLKIIIIMGSDSIPSFMQSYITMETRDTWLIWLTIATISLYFFTIIFDTYAKKLVRKNNKEVSIALGRTSLEESTLHKEEHVFILFCHSYADLIIFTLGALVFLILKPLLWLTVLLIILLQVLLFLSLLKRKSCKTISKLKFMIINHTDDFVTYLSTINFLFVFLLLIAEYLISENTNAIFSILCLLIARRMNNAIRKLAKTALKLEEHRQSFNTNIQGVN